MIFIYVLLLSFGLEMEDGYYFSNLKLAYVLISLLLKTLQHIMDRHILDLKKKKINMNIYIIIDYILKGYNS